MRSTALLLLLGGCALYFGDDSVRDAGGGPDIVSAWTAAG
jgi:hypothetical protein